LAIVAIEAVEDTQSSRVVGQCFAQDPGQLHQGNPGAYIVDAGKVMVRMVAQVVQDAIGIAS